MQGYIFGYGEKPAFYFPKYVYFNKQPSYMWGVYICDNIYNLESFFWN